MEQEEIAKWVEEVLKPVLKARPGKDGWPAADEIEDRTQFETHPKLAEFNRLGQLALLSADADRIKEYVFESDKLPEIRGGSQILDDLNKARKKPRKPGERNINSVFADCGFTLGQTRECVIYDAGGGLLALVPPEAAEALCDGIECLYAEKTGATTISCVWQELSPLELLYGWKPWQRWDADRASERHFGEVMQLQGLLLRRRKQEKPARPFFETLLVMRRCASCGIRPAQETQEYPELRHLCWVCHKKAERSQERGGKKEWTCKFERFLEKKADERETQDYLGNLSLQQLGQVEGASDISEIAAASRRGRYVGFVYADGNRVGRQIEHSHSVKEYHDKSQDLLEITPRVVYNALQHHLCLRDVERETKGVKRQVRIHPFEIITIGGDDVLLIVPGDVALSIALDICRTFEQGLAQSGLFEKATMSAGVVIADAGNPIYFMRDLAEQLLKSAKQRSASEDCGGTVDFLVLKSQSMLDRSLKGARRRPPLQWRDSDKETRRLTTRPVTLEEACRLIQTVQVLRQIGFPRGQLVQLRRALRQGRFEATLYYLYQRVRYPDRLKRTFAWIEKEWGFQPLRDPLPWQEMSKGDDRVYQTFWEDVADLWDLVPGLASLEWEALEQAIYPSGGGSDEG